MRSHSVVTKLWLAFTGMILVVMVPLEVALHQLLTDFYARQVTEPLVYHSEQLAYMIAANPVNIRSASAMGQMVGGEVVVLDRTGEPILFPGSSAFRPPAGVISAALAGKAFVGQAGDASGKAVVLTGVPIPDIGGAVLLLAPAEPIQRSLTLARRYLWAAGTGSLLLGTGLALMLSRQLLRPVIAIEKATQSIASGDLSTRIPVTVSDEIGHLATAVNKMTAQLQAFDTRRREFLANVAHELRTPLAYIRGYSQAIIEGIVNTDGERLRYQRVIHEETLRIGRLVDDLMDLAQMEEGQMGFVPTPLDLSILIEQTVATVRPLADEKGVEIHTQVSSTLPAIVADGGRIQQVIFNLLDNGLRYTPPGGKVLVSTLLTGTWAEVRVTDTGQGVDPDVLPLVFERFHKGTGSGRGLGLAIVRSIVRAHGGHVGVESTPGEGSTFSFRLPVSMNNGGVTG